MMLAQLLALPLIVASVTSFAFTLAITRRYRALRREYSKLVDVAATAITARDHAIIDMKNYERRFDEQFAMLDGIVQEKNQTWRLYHENAGVAQDWLLRECSSLARALNAVRAEKNQPPVELPPALTALVAEFGETVAQIPAEPPGKTAAEVKQAALAIQASTSA